MFLAKSGEGNPVRKLHYCFKNYAQTYSAALAEWNHKSREGMKLDLDLTGNPVLNAGLIVELDGSFDQNIAR